MAAVSESSWRWSDPTTRTQSLGFYFELRQKTLQSPPVNQRPLKLRTMTLSRHLRTTSLKNQLSMKRYLPFIIIAAVAALTVGAGVMLYRAKQRAIPTASTTSTPVDRTISKTADTF